MKRNLLSFKQRIPLDTSIDNMLEQLRVVMNGLESIYSYVIFVNDKEYTVSYAICEEQRYNTFQKHQVIGCILDDIERYKNVGGKNMIGFKQPDIDLLIDIYEPLVQKLATLQRNKWSMLEHDDLCQICRMTMVILYNKNYLIHKKLIERAFNNAVLQEVKKMMIDFEVISLETRTQSEDMEKLTLRDTIRDVDEETRLIDVESEEIKHNVFNEVKSILIDIIGERQFEQLYRDYANGHTTTWSRRKMQTLKNIFENEKLTRLKFNNKYGG